MKRGPHVTFGWMMSKLYYTVSIRYIIRTVYNDAGVDLDVTTSSGLFNHFSKKKSLFYFLLLTYEYLKLKYIAAKASQRAVYINISI